MMWSMIVEEDEVTLLGIVMNGKAPLLRIMFRYSIAISVRLLLSILMSSLQAHKKFYC